MDGQARMLLLPPGVRRASRSDVLHMVGVARKAYSKFPVDWGHVAAWLSREVDNNPAILGCITEGAASIAMSHEWFWRPGVPEVTVLFLAGTPWGMVRCARATLAWAQSMGADKLKMDAETGADLGPIVRRLGLPFEAVKGFSVRVR
jgi:hypothetical protein